jgi:hypothetical protein
MHGGSHFSSSNSSAGKANEKATGGSRFESRQWPEFYNSAGRSSGTQGYSYDPDSYSKNANGFSYGPNDKLVLALVADRAELAVHICKTRRKIWQMQDGNFINSVNHKI